MQTLKNNKEGRTELLRLMTESDGTCEMETKNGINVMTVGTEKVIISDMFLSSLLERGILHV